MKQPSTSFLKKRSKKLLNYIESTGAKEEVEACPLPPAS
jgi:hypothetical protein